jgi:hypothetical protein
MAKLRKIKSIDVDSQTTFIEEWSSKQIGKWVFDTPRHPLAKQGMVLQARSIWVRFLGCLETLCRNCLALFVVGSLIGKTTMRVCCCVLGGGF